MTPREREDAAAVEAGVTLERARVEDGEEEVVQGKLVQGDGRRGRSAAKKVTATLRQLSTARPGAEAMELTVASVCLGIEKAIAERLRAAQGSEVDEFVAALTRFLATHRSDDARRLVVVEMPRMPRTPEGPRRKLPAGVRLRLLDRAEAAAEASEEAGAPL